MAGKFSWQSFSSVNLSDRFFDSLKSDYPGFNLWFEKKAHSGEKALVFHDTLGIGAFLYLKKETEQIQLTNKLLPAIPRLKIGTLRLAERFRKQRLGEGALGVSLWFWRDLGYDEIYVTVFDKHKELINLFVHFGFRYVGNNLNGECIYLKSRDLINYTDAYKSFPFINPNFKSAGVLPIYDMYHDKLFPYSELKNGRKEIVEETAGNGVTKIYIATPFDSMKYTIGQPLFIYRIDTSSKYKTYKSAITSYCTITKVLNIKENGIANLNYQDFIKEVGNKTIFLENELESIYNNFNKKNIVIIELVYNGFFGKGNNVIHKKLKENGLFAEHPYKIEYTQDQFFKILSMGDVNVSNIIIN